MEINTVNKRTTQAKLLLVLSALCGLGLIPFVVFRFMQKDWVMVICDVGIVLTMAFIFIYVYRTNKTKYPSLLFASMVLSASTISFYVNGGFVVNWIYPAMLSTFFIVKPRSAVIINFAVLLIYFPKLVIYFETIEIIAVIFSASMSNVIAFGFVEVLRVQKKELKRLASEDYLTKTGNRRALKLFLDALWVKQQKNSTPVSLIILDLDHFKKVNDDYGHLVGDNALVSMSKLIKRITGNNNHVFRYGGEEFLIVFPCSAQDGYALAEKIRKEVKNTDLIEQTKITVSLGVAQYVKGETISKWIHRVDLALYKAKKEGRDQTHLA